ncbi:hypothetical protein CC86DRAFT_468589 [Ophiobolus disseminans]|uniref:Uncharacterized protein n=1 Tax=Ophiobolus disseminans TaxID=1469910 RepID=A0A6A6ZTT7_9PLEO|nr:hypothetical protein CC86DRAFT_468589 [Ophiobolus disseminans]
MTSPSSILVTGGNSHTLKLRVETAGYQGATFAADDFYLIVTSGPDGAAVCNPTPAPTPSCFAAPSANLVKNPGFNYDPAFETSMAYWSVTQGSAYSTNSWVWDYAGYPSGNGFLGYTVREDAGKVDSTQYLRQDNIDIPQGAVLDFSVYFNPQRTGNTADKPFSVTLKFDDQVVRSSTPTVSNTWVVFGSTPSAPRLSATGSGPHSLLLEVRTGGVENADIYFADDFSIKVLAGPNGQRICYTP